MVNLTRAVEIEAAIIFAVNVIRVVCASHSFIQAPPLYSGGSRYAQREFLVSIQPVFMIFVDWIHLHQL